MRLRAAEKQAIITLLDQEWDDVDALAKTMFDTCCELLLAREWHVIVAGGDGWVTVFGPYATGKQAVKGIPATEVRDGRFLVRRIVTSIHDMEDE